MRRQKSRSRLKQFIGALGGVAILMLAAKSAHALLVKNATLSNGTVTVSGSQAAPGAQISWEGLPVSVANKNGNFGFSTQIVPTDCVGTVTGGASVDVLITGCTPAPPPPAFPATGQTTCWDVGGNPAPCSGTGQDGDTQTGATLSYTSNADGTITDNNTGLVWEKKTYCTEEATNDPTPNHCYLNIYTWRSAFNYVAALNAANFAGHNDWRLPNVKELQSILNYQNVAPGVSSEFNTCGSTAGSGSCTQSGFGQVNVAAYWSSTSYVGLPGWHWCVDFSGFPGGINCTSLAFAYVRAVRGGS